MHQGEERYRLLFDNAPISITVTDTSGLVIDCNKATEAFTGYPRESIVGKRFDQLATLDPLHLPKLAENLKKLACGQDIEPYTLQMVRNDGEKRWVMVRHSLLKLGDTVIGIQVFATDITARKEAEDALRDREEKLRVMFDTIEEAITVTDIEGRIIEANAAAVCNSGCGCKEEMIGCNGFEFIAEKDRARCMRDLAEALEEGHATTKEYTFVDKSGREYEGWVSGNLMCDSSDTPVGFINVAMDLSKLKDAQRAVEESEERYRSVVENASEAIVVAQGGFIKFFNPKALEITGYTGYSTEELINKSFAELIHPDDRNMVIERHLRRLNGEKFPGVYPFRIVDRNGFIKWVEIDAVLIDWEGRPATLNFISDITERKQAEDALRESEEKLRILFESIGDAITVTDLSGRIIEVNGAALRMGGFKNKEELVGRDGLEFVCEEDRAKVKENINRAFKNGQSNPTIEYTLLTQHGTEYNVEVSVSFLYDNCGKPAGVITVTKDVTERKRMNELIQFYITEITRAQEEERKRIARELHDDTAQSLAALMLDIESVINTKGRLPKNVIDKLERIRGKADDIMQGVRRFSTEMRPGVLDQLGLVAALGWLADSVGDGIDARVELIGKERRLISEAELVLFRITQEALSNVRRHAQATQVLITVEFAPKKVKLEVKDNGKGFELPKKLEDFAVRGSLGILGMHERARIIAGNFSIQSKPGLGTVVSIEVAK